MGFSLAKVCAERGADVVLIAGPVSLSTPHASIRRVDVESAEDMYRAAVKEYVDADAAVCCAAVADYAPAECSDTKLKRSSDSRTIVLKPNKDIAAELGKIKRPDNIWPALLLKPTTKQRMHRQKCSVKISILSSSIHCAIPVRVLRAIPIR